MRTPFGADVLKICQEAREHQERPGIENLDIEQLKSEPRFLNFLEEQGLCLDDNGNIVEKNNRNNE